MNNVNQNTVINFCGSVYDVEQFAKEHTEGNTDEAIELMQLLVDKGDAKITQRNSKQTKVLSRALKEQAVLDKAEEYAQIQEDSKDFVAEKKRSEKLTHAQIEFDFGSMLKAQEFQANMKETLRIKSSNTEIALRDGIFVCVFKDITESELGYMNRIYKTELVTQTAINALDKTANVITDSVHYGATKVVAPAVQVGAKAGASLLKTLLTTTAKTAGTLVSATTEGVKSAVQEIQYDPDVLKASAELINTKDATKRAFSNMVNRSMGGGRIVK